MKGRLVDGEIIGSLYGEKKKQQNLSLLNTVKEIGQKM